MPKINRYGWPRPELHLPAAHQKGLQVNFYPFHIGDYASATRHLTWDEDAAYRRLLDAYYTREGPLPLDPMAIYRLVVASSDAQRQAVHVVLEEFFVKTDDGWRHERCDAEIAKASDKKAKATASAMRRWSERDAIAMRTQCERNANASETPCERIEMSCEGNAPNPNPNPNKKITTLPSGKSKKSTLLADDFQPNDTGVEYATARGVKIATELPSFRNYHQSKGTAMKDWQAAWRTWCDNAVKFGNAHGLRDAPENSGPVTPELNPYLLGEYPRERRQWFEKHGFHDEARKCVVL